MNGFLFVDKKAGLTSRDVCNEISRQYQTKKVGHFGTLDPFATGLLIVGMGKATKAGAFLNDCYKKYRATLKLGIETSTMDLTGETIATKEIPTLNKSFIMDALNSFLGDSKQLPPMTSAIHVNGVKLYKLAHKGIEVDREYRDIHVYSIDLIDYSADEITFEVEVSSGTYIRVLGSDIAKKLGTVGHLSSLRRLSIEDLKIEDYKEDRIYNIFDVLKGVSEVVKIDDDIEVKKYMDGQHTFINGNYKKDKVMIVDKENNPIAMYTRVNKDLYEFSRGLF